MSRVYIQHGVLVTHISISTLGQDAFQLKQASLYIPLSKMYVFIRIPSYLRLSQIRLRKLPLRRRKTTTVVVAVIVAVLSSWTTT